MCSLPRHVAIPIDVHQRRGTTLVETTVAAALLITIMSMLVPVLTRSAEKRQEIDQREQALAAVANLLEHAALQSSPSRESLQPIADQCIQHSELANPEWKIVVTPEQSPPMNRVEATLSWQSRPLVRNSATLIRWYRRGTP